MSKNVESQIKSGIYKESRLPSYVIPHHYDLKLKPNLKDFTFSGTVKISVTCDQKANEIFLNANELKIHKGHVELVDGSIVNLVNVIYNKEGDVISLKFEKDQVEPRLIVLDFTGILNDQLKGFYRSSFEMGHQTINMATTQFAATDARQSFPCFDEPALKATFRVTLVYDTTPILADGQTYVPIALSNSNVLSETSLGNEKITIFETTPKMSTYLLAFIIGPLEFIESICCKTGRKIRVYTTPGKREQGQFSLEVACKSLEFFEDYFGIKYPLTKLDLVAIPDISYGAMENWGLITYRETTLLVDPLKTSTTAKHYIALTVAHELSHQWFGNLVTMEWWTHLWLNEGFASFMQYICIDSLYPNFGVWNQFVTDSFNRAQDLDSLDNSHPIEVPVNHASEIDQIFDAISYNKGASIIRMLHDYIGDEVFRQGLQEYLKKFAYGNASTHDLWTYVEKASGKQIVDLMAGWTSQKGYPWLMVEIDENNNTKGDLVLHLKQNKFIGNGKLPAGDEKLIWNIPLSILSSSPNNDIIKDWMDKETKTIVIPKSGSDWIKLNAKSIGFYRTAYSHDLLERLNKAINDRLQTTTNLKDNVELGPLDRLNVLNDCQALCQAGHLSTTGLLKLLSCFEHEFEYIVWCTIEISVNRLYGLYLDTEFSKPFNAFTRRLYSKIYATVGPTAKQGERQTDPMLRGLVMNRLIMANEPEVIKMALSLFKDQVSNEKQIPADLKPAIYKAASIHGDDQDFDQLFKIYRREDLQEEKNRVAAALGFTRDPNRLHRVIKFAFSSEVRINDLDIMIALRRSNPALAWKVFQDHEELIRKNYTAINLLTKMVEHSTHNLNTKKYADEVEQYFLKHPFLGTERIVQQSLETIRMSAEWLARQRTNASEINQLLQIP